MRSWHVVLVVVIFAAFVRLRVADAPLERDEGEYAYAGQLILQGVPPYQLVYNMKFPGTYYAYAGIMGLLGETPWAIRAGLMAVNAASAFLLFLIARRLIGDLGGVVTAATFSVLSLDRWMMGVFAHATHFVVLPALGSWLCLMHAAESGRARLFLAAGALAGLAVLMKQQGVFLAMFTFAFLIWQERQRRGQVADLLKRAGLFAAGAAAPFGLIALLFAAQGVLGRFWFWTFQYARVYVSEVPASEAGLMFQLMWTVVTQSNLVIWIGAITGFALLWIVRWPATLRFFAGGLAAASLVAISPGFYFREHYFILLLPAAALGAGIGAASIARLLARAISKGMAQPAAGAIAMLPLAIYAGNESTYLFSLPATAVSRSVYGQNPFAEAPEIAKYIEAHTAAPDRIAVLGSEPEIYFYAGRHSATGYIYMYPLMEPQPLAAGMQREMMMEIETAHPKYIVLAQVPTSWSVLPASDRTVLDWMGRYLKSCYTDVAVPGSPAQPPLKLFLRTGDAACRAAS